jgi:hypothetical protein
MTPIIVKVDYGLGKIPDGTYAGVWCGYSISADITVGPMTLKCALHTAEGVRGIVNVLVQVKGGNIEICRPPARVAAFGVY